MSIKYLERLPQASYRLVRQIGEWADAENVSVYLVGGTVRDLILKKQGVDLDFVVEGASIAFAKKVAGHLGAESIRTHKEFGTASLVLKNGLMLDFAMCRAEKYSEPGVLPQVRPSAVKEDLFRRDFSINAMALRINKDRWNELVDPFGGLKDLQAKRIRILHDKSFIDDSTRMLRAVRFEQRLGFKIEPKTLKLLKGRLASRKTVDHVSIQRFFNEFVKIFAEKNVLFCLKRYKALGLQAVLHPSFIIDLEAVKTVQKRLLLVAKKYAVSQEECWKMSVMAFLEPQAADVRREFLSKLSLSATDRKTFSGVDAAIDFLGKLCQNALSPSVIYRDLKVFTQDQCLYLCCRTQDRRVLQCLERFLKKDRLIELEIDGNDVKALGASGARIRDLLERTLSRKIDVGFASRKDELDFVKHLMIAAG